MSIASARGAWGSRTGFILAAAGSAVGLGNIWGFPTQVGQGGGAAFVLVYLFCVLFICFPILVAEIAIGRRARQSPVGSFQTLRPGSSWWLVGALGVLTGAGILSFYSVIAGWTIAYMWFTVTGALAEAPQDVNSFFSAFIADGSTTVLLTFAVLLHSPDSFRRRSNRDRTRDKNPNACAFSPSHCACSTCDDTSRS